MFYDNFSNLCTQKGVTPSAVMRAIGLNKSSATYWKRGTIPSSDTLQKLAEYFGVSVDYLLGLEQIDRNLLAHEAGPEVYKKFEENYQRHHGAQARANKAMDQMSEEGRSKVADYAEDILPRYRATPAPQPPAGMGEGKDTTPPLEGTEGPGEGK